ncbi:MAG: PTS transporter subunit EIIB, partial [Acholeplasmatales bacterium]|nr:PTS transporter subunit EIIB [Acholeplasmatales bacterium]
EVNKIMFLFNKINVIIYSVIGALVLVGIIVGLILILKKKPKRIKVDEEFINNIFTLLGGKQNINDITVDNARLKFKINDLDIVDLNGLKAVSNQGVFVTGDNIKTLFKYDSETIKKAMKERM